MGGIQYAKTDYLAVIAHQDTFAFSALFSHYSNATSNLLYLNKIDTTGYKQIPRLARTVVQGIIGYFSSLDKIEVHVYCATSEQYLFHESCESKAKNILTDRQLVSWWMKTISLHANQKNYVFVPGESIVTMKKMIPVDTIWNWGFPISANESANKLPQFEDNLITKGLQYSNPEATVGELMEVMDCMETASGVRALLTASIDKTESRYQVEDQEYHSMDQYCCNLLDYSFANEDVARKSTGEFIKENKVKMAAFSISNVLPEKSVQVEVKRKAEHIADITNLIKKKKK
ncbi:hypothetical protein HDV01_005923 [Terramyces sp. JEL0728]|nr:hypothetical protein HDV01_005923 [Terramyces sp. JEL0728]